MKQITRFLSANIIYFLWFVVNFTMAFFLFGANYTSLLLCIVLYIISIGIALSPVGEFILKQLNGVRPLETSQHIEYLQPLFDEVYEQAREVYPRVPKIKLGIRDDMTVNAFALGRHTVSVNQGAIEAFTPQELQGIMAHEIGHIVHGHTKALLLNVVGNGVFTLFTIFMQVTMLFFDLIMGIITQSIISDLLFMFFRYILKIALLAFSLIGLLITAINSRRNEYQADKFAFEIGFGDEITSGLYYLQKISFGSGMGIMEKLKSSHPHINARIMRLESLAMDEVA